MPVTKSKVNKDGTNLTASVTIIGNEDEDQPLKMTPTDDNLTAAIHTQHVNANNNDTSSKSNTSTSSKSSNLIDTNRVQTNNDDKNDNDDMNITLNQTNNQASTLTATSTSTANYQSDENVVINTTDTTTSTNDDANDTQKVTLRESTIKPTKTPTNTLEDKNDDTVNKNVNSNSNMNMNTNASNMNTNTIDPKSLSAQSLGRHQTDWLVATVKGQIDIVIDSVFSDCFHSSHRALNKRGKLVCVGSTAALLGGTGSLEFSGMPMLVKHDMAKATTLMSNTTVYDVFNYFETKRDMYRKDLLRCKTSH